MKSLKEKIQDGLKSYVIGDVLGVPVEFRSKESLDRRPVTTFIGHGTYNQPVGSWSDDTSMTFVTIDHLLSYNGFNPKYLMEKFVDWYRNGYMTPLGYTFDIGIGTKKVILDYDNNKNIYNEYTKLETNNGNGSLMRIIPIALFYNYDVEIYRKYKISLASSLTHGHKLSIEACYIYSNFIKYLLETNDKFKAYERLTQEKNQYDEIYHDILTDYRTVDTDTTGFVVHTLKTIIKVFMTTTSTKEALFKAVNLGGDTDTITALTGFLSGLVYGLDETLEDLWSKVIRHQDLEKLINDFSEMINNKNQRNDLE